MSSNNTDSFAIGDSAFIYTAHTGGLDSSIQQVTARHFSKRANYYFNGVAPQMTGFSLPDSIIGSTPFPGMVYGSVTINNPLGATLSQAVFFTNNAHLFLVKGVFTINSLLTMNTSTQVWVDTGTFASAPTYIRGVGVVYTSLGYNALAVTTGYELLPTVDTTIQLLQVYKPGATITLGSSVKVNGTVTIDSGFLDVSTSNYNITIDNSWTGAGAFLHNDVGIGAFVARSGTVTFNGTSSNSSMIGGSYGVVFNNLVLNNPQGLKVFQDEDSK